MADQTDTSGPKPDDQTLVKGGFVDKARRTLGKVPFLEDAAAGYYAAFDPKTPKHIKVVLIGALAYFILPVDAVPDFIAVLGFSDDAAVIWATWKAVASSIKPEHHERARQLVARLKGEA